MKDYEYRIGQEIWIIKRNYAEQAYGGKLEEAKPFKVVKRKIVTIRMFGQSDHGIRYTIATDVGMKPDINDMNTFGEQEFRSKDLFNTDKEAIAATIEIIDQRINELRKIRSVYLETDTVAESDKEWETVADDIGDLFDEIQPL